MPFLHRIHTDRRADGGLHQPIHLSRTTEKYRISFPLCTIGQSLVDWLVPKTMLSQANGQEQGPTTAECKAVYLERTPNVPKLLQVPIVIMMVFDFWSRVFVVVEDFISLRSLPASAFTVVTWTKNLPHSQMRAAASEVMCLARRVVSIITSMRVPKSLEVVVLPGIHFYCCPRRTK